MNSKTGWCDEFGIIPPRADFTEPRRHTQLPLTANLVDYMAILAVHVQGANPLNRGVGKAEYVAFDSVGVDLPCYTFAAEARDQPASSV